MTLSIFDHVKGCVDGPTDDLFKRLHDINIKMFDELLTEEEEWEEGEKKVYTRQEVFFIVLYIVFAYSLESPFLIYGADYIEEKFSIAQRVGLPEYLHGKIVNMKSAMARKIIVRYINSSVSNVFKYLQFRKDQYRILMSNSMLSMVDNEGTVDTKNIVDVNKSMKELLREINEYEDLLREEYRSVYENLNDIDEVDRDEKRKNDRGNVESSQFIS